MEKRRLGKTGLEVTLLGLGGLFVSKVGAQRQAGVEATRHAVARGINYIDTAPGYGDSEEVLGEALGGIDQPIVLSTKLGGRPMPFEPRNIEHLRQSFAESLRLLGRETIDLLMIHEPDRPGQYDWWTDHDAVQGPVLDFICELKEQGKVKAIGLGGTTTSHMAHLIRTGKFDVVLTAFNYSLLYREAQEEVIPDAVKLGMGIVVGSPLQQGVFARRRDEEVARRPRWMSLARQAQFQALYEFVDQCGLSLPELAMRFVISNPHISTVLTGSRSVQEVDLNIAAVEKGPLPADMLSALDAIAAMQPCRPYEEPFSLHFGDGYTGPGRA